MRHLNFFGYKFGESINSDSEGIIECSENKITCWGTNRDITPTKYDVQVGRNKDGNIFSLTARQSLVSPNSKKDCMFMAGRIANEFSKRYGIIFNKYEENSSFSTKLVWADVNIKSSVVKVSVSCEKSSITGVKNINYVLNMELANNNYAKFTGY